MPNEMCDIAKIPTLYAVLKQKGLQDDLLQKIFYINAYNFCLNL
jgi:hypothetical protein